jgi:hypothetical protein
VLFALWLLSQTLGFAMPALCSVHLERLARSGKPTNRVLENHGGLSGFA